MEFFCDGDGQAYVSVKVDEHHETLSLTSKQFKSWSAYEFLKRTGETISAQAIDEATTALAGMAAGGKHDVHVRIGEHQGATYLDLGDDDWTAIEITADGWRAVSNPPVYFRRPPGMLPLPMPVAGGDLNALRPLVNVEDDDDWMLFVSVLLAALRPRGPYPVMLSSGEQGSAKSSASRILRRLIDPKKTELRGLSHSTRDLAIASRHSWVMPFDNISSISGDISDALCGLSTGGGFGTRLLYANDEEITFNEQRPVALNGITEVVTRPDLLDRAVMLCHPVIPDDKRMTDEEFNERLDAIRPSVLGALLDVVAGGLASVDSVELDKLPRMAGFAKWIVACSPALGWGETDFLDAYAANREMASAVAMEVVAHGGVHHRSREAGV